MALSPDTLAAIQKYGPQVDSIARQYGISGTALLGKLVWGESSDRGSAVSSAGARGWAQFMPASRQDLINNYGIDPWKNVDQAVHGAVLHLQGKVNGKTGLAGYNPGDPSYTSYILGQKIGNVLGHGAPPSAHPTSPSTTTSAAGGAEQLVPSAPTSGPSLQSGQGGDYTSVLSSLLGQGQPQQPPSSGALQQPAFMSRLAQPQGFHPIESSGAPQQQAASADPGLLGTLRGSGVGVDAGAPDPTAQGTPAIAGPSSRSVVANVELARNGHGADAALEWAKSKIGFKETGENSGGLASYANSRFGMSNQPWCAMFTSLAVTKGGAPRSARTASVATVRAKAKAGEGYVGFVDPGHARSGDLILFGNDHIGMVDHIAGGKVFYVGGNQSNGVTMASTAVGNGDIVRPKYGGG